MFDATNRGDDQAFLDSFAEDAVLNDWGRTFTGHDAIAGWNARENIGVQTRFEVRDAQQAGNRTTVTVQVTGNGYNGPGTFVFVTENDLISRFDIG
jgi:ketosteroid isomerase-like protein